MSTFDEDRTRQVRVGQSVNLAIQMAINENMGADSETPVLTRAAELLGPVLAFIDQAQNAALEDARKAAVVQAFPGAQIEPQAAAQIPQPNPVFVRNEPGGPVTPAPRAFDPQAAYEARQAAFGQPVQPSPVPGVEDGDPATAALWRQYFNDPSAFWDNRRDKRNPKAPDFKAKNGGEGLWISSRRNPSWVATSLRDGSF